MTTTLNIKDWDVRRAANRLGIKLVAYDEAVLAVASPEEDPANVRGYSMRNEVAIRPGDPHPTLVAFHELAHQVLGHTKGSMSLAASVGHGSEVEAHATAILLAHKFDFDSTQWDQAHEENLLMDYSRGSLYLFGHVASEVRLERIILPAARTILQAGLR